MKKFILILLSISALFTSPLEAKKNPDLVKANYFYHNLAYHEAIPYFENVAATQPDAEVLSALADCYRFTKNMEKAASWYSKAVQLADCAPDTKLRYGQTLMTLQRYDEAKKWLLQYQKASPAERRVANLISSCEQAPKHNVNQSTQAILLSFNTDGSEFGPSLRNNELIFSSDTTLASNIKPTNKDKWTGSMFYNLYRVNCNGTATCQADVYGVASNINTKYHDGPAVFTADGNNMYFTRTHFREAFLSKGSVPDGNGTVHLQIKMATGYQPEKSSFDHIADFPFNSKEYSTAHPSLSPSGKTMVFVSDMPGGKGGNDLYVSKMGENGEWGQPVNLEGLNTEGNEMFPTLADDNTLYFSSNGLVGWGGLDLYKSKWDAGKNTFVNPTHMGASVNSSYDDMSLVLNSNGKSGYFSSNRPAAKGGDNIYYADLSALYLYIIAIDGENDQPIQGALINVIGLDDKRNFTADAEGKMITPIMGQSNYKVDVSKAGYKPVNFDVNTIGNLESDTLAYKVTLAPDFNVTYNAFVVDAITHQSLDDVMVIMNKSGSSEIADTAILRTGENFSAELSPDADYTIYAIKDNYYGGEKVVSTKGMKRTMTTMTLNDTIFMKELRVGLVYKIDNIYYDYDKSNIREDAKPSLNELLSILERYPQMSIQINSHTDCRGSAAYNQKLSNARAQSVIKYLMQRGVGSARLKAKGFGENSPVHNCPTCEKCSESEHQDNRRTEFEILSM